MRTILISLALCAPVVADTPIPSQGNRDNSGSSKQVSNPNAESEFIQKTSALEVKKFYAPLLKAANLSPETYTKALARLTTSHFEIQKVVLNHSANDPSSKDPAGWRPQVIQIYSSTETELKQILGPQAYAKFSAALINQALITNISAVTYAEEDIPKVRALISKFLLTPDGSHVLPDLKDATARMLEEAQKTLTPESYNVFKIDWSTPQSRLTIDRPLILIPGKKVNFIYPSIP